MSAEVKDALTEEFLPVLNKKPLTRQSRVPISETQVCAAEDYATVDKEDAVKTAVEVDEASESLLDGEERFLDSLVCPNRMSTARCCTCSTTSISKKVTSGQLHTIS
jgi:hypothetical protein